MQFEKRYYFFHQGYCDGYFQTDSKLGIAECIFIEAGSPKEANNRAKRLGLYFDGAKRKIDNTSDRWVHCNKNSQFFTLEEAVAYQDEGLEECLGWTKAVHTRDNFLWFGAS
jgi:hypothetical protein